MSIHQGNTHNTPYICEFSCHAILSRNIGDQDLIVRGVTALELMDMFTGYVNESPIEVYSKTDKLNNIFDYRVTSSFNHIDHQEVRGIRCTTFNQTINDMLDEFDTTDEAALAEALAKYYEAHGNFDSITINPKHEKTFQNMKEWAMEYYMER